jgi:phosphatidylinositol alpha-1,6-mannosyltransferase
MAKVLLLSPSFFSVGGIQRLMQAIVTYSEHDIDVIVRRSEYDRDRAAATDARVLPTRLTLGRHYLTIGRLLAGGSYDAMYVSSLKHADAALVAAPFGTPVVCHVHGNDLFGLHTVDPVTRVLHRWGRTYISRYVAVSDWTGRQLTDRGADPSAVEVIPNGVDAARFQRSQADGLRAEMGVSVEDFLLLTVARLVPRKGHRLVLDALKEIEGAVYAVVGTGPEEERLRRAAETDGIADRVVFAGYVPDDELSRYYRACDAYVMPSLHLSDAQSVEGFGLSFLEANAAGRVAIGTRTGGIPTAIQHEDTGLLCEPTASSVTAAVRRVKNDPELRTRLEANAEDWAAAHDWTQIVPRIDRVLAG